MDASKLETFGLNIQKQGPQALTVTFNARVVAGTDVADLWAGLKPQILSEPALTGFALAPDGEDLNLVRSQRSLSVTLRFTGFAPAGKG